MHLEEEREFRAGAQVWRVTRHVSVDVGAVEKAPYPQTGRRGLLFRSPSGDERFLEMSLLELPSRSGFWALPETRLQEFLAQAK